MTKQKMQLPLNCGKHTHDGYGTSKDVPCPWCEIERLSTTTILRDQIDDLIAQVSRLSAENARLRGYQAEESARPSLAKEIARSVEPPAAQCKCTVACCVEEHGETYGGECRLAVNRRGDA